MPNDRAESGPNAAFSMAAKRLPQATKVAAAVALYEGGTAVYEKGMAWWRNHYEYTISIDEDESVYADVHDWLTQATNSKDHRKLKMTSRGSFARASSQPVAMEESSDPGQSPKLRLMHNDQRRKIVSIDGHKVEVRVNSETAEIDSKKFMTKTIEFSCRTFAGQQAVIKLIETLHANRAERKPRLKMINQWGGWNTRNDLPLRSLDSVILPEAQKSRIVDDFSKFLEAEKRYTDLAIPWHRGYMLHGPPGGGKTSLVKALATEFGLDMWYVSLGSLKEDASLLGILADVSPRSVLLLEDIDTAKIAQEGDEQEQGTISTASLLNALDGVATPHGLITIMTTNHFEKLDPRLTRSGRMDLIEEILPPSQREIKALFKMFYDQDLDFSYRLPEGPLPVSQSEISEVFKRHLDSPQEARHALYIKLNEVLGATSD